MDPVAWKKKTPTGVHEAVLDELMCELVVTEGIAYILLCSTYTLKVADKQFTITPDMVEVKRFTKTVHGEFVWIYWSADWRDSR